jgi:TPR repeat protein
MSAYEQKLIEVSGAISEKEYEKALSLLTPLVEKSVPGALGLLGLMYQLGEGVERDGTKAVELLKRAVELGDGVSAHNLGTIYSMGMPGISQDHQLSRQYYRKAKAMGAQFAADEFYE